MPPLIGLRPDVVRVPLVGLGLRRRRGRRGPAARLPARAPRQGGGADVGRAVLADPAARRRLDGQPGRPAGSSATARPRWSRSAAAGPPTSRSSRDRASPTCSPAAAGSTPTPSARWAGTSAPRGLQDRAGQPRCPSWSTRYVGGDVDAFLADHGLTRADIEWWVAPPRRTRRCSRRCRRRWGSRGRRCRLTWDSLAAIGNLSSASVLHVLADTLARPPAAARVLRRSCWPWARGSAPSWCCCGRRSRAA